MNTELKKEIAQQLEYQESILQSTRGTHYLFQALFLGMSLAAILLQLNFLYDIPEENIQGWSLLSYMMCSVMSVSVPLFGLNLMHSHAERVWTRGIVIDFLQRLLIFKRGAEKTDGVECLFELDISPNALSTVKQVERLCRLHVSRKSPVESDCVMGCRNIQHWWYLTFYGNIYDGVEAVPEAWENARLRGISDFRNGDRGLFGALWLLFGTFSVILSLAPVSVYLSVAF